MFGWLHFPDALTIGHWAQHGLQWHFFGMWVLVINGIAYFTYGLVTGRFRRMLLPIRWRELVATIKDALRLRLAHDDPTQYNTVQKLLYIGVLAAGVMIVISGLAMWKPVQFSELLALFGSFQNARLVHFLCMTAIVLFLVVHVTLALLVPHTLVAMVTGGPEVADPAAAAAAAARDEEHAMTLRTPSRSIFRPADGIDQSVLRENRRLVEGIDRRNVLRGTLSLGALTLLSGCDVTETDQVQTFLRAVSSWNDRVQAFIFRPDHLAPTFSEKQVVKPPRFNAHYDIEEVKPVDAFGWKLELCRPRRRQAAVDGRGHLPLPEQELIIRHICVEGWDYIGQWSGPNLRMFLERIGADLSAKYVAFRCADGYTESIDMPTALHPQTILATKYAQGADHRSVRLSAAAAHLDQARVQEPQMDHGNGGDQYLSGNLLQQGRLQLVQRDLRGFSRRILHMVIARLDRERRWQRREAPCPR